MAHSTECVDSAIIAEFSGSLSENCNNENSQNISSFANYPNTNNSQSETNETQVENAQSIFATEFQRGFREECREGSGISQSLYDATIYFIEDTGYWEPNRELNQHVSLNYQTSKPHRYGELACFRNEDGTLWQAKPQYPKIDNKKGKSRKYESIQGGELRAYLPVIPPEEREKISKRYKVIVPTIGSFWEWLEKHPEIPIIITEGGKKALALLSLGYVAIALTGVDGGVLKNDKIAGEKIRKLKPELIHDLKRFRRQKREWELAFDQDANTAANFRVQCALDTLAFCLSEGILIPKVSIILWDGQNGHCKGVDDLIVNAGVPAWEQAHKQRIPIQEWRISRKIANAVRRKPDLHIGNREFKEVAATLPTSGIVAFLGGKGTTKSEAIALMLRDRTWLSLTSLRSLARDQATGWGGVFVNDGDRYGNRLLDKSGQPVNGGSVSRSWAAPSCSWPPPPPTSSTAR